MSKERYFSIHLKYIEVIRRTNTTGDVLLEIRIDDNWNVDGDWELFCAMDPSCPVQNFERSSSQEIHVVWRERLAQCQAMSTPDYL